MDPRRVPDGTTEIGYTTADGTQRTLHATDGVVTPKTPDDAAVLDGYGFEVTTKPDKPAKPKPSTGEEG